MSRAVFVAAGALSVLFVTEARAQTAKPRTIAVFPHDTKAFTEGLVLFEGKFFESTGLNGQSALRRVTIATGAIEKNIALDSTLFGEGLARVDRQLIQLTYKTGAAIVYDLDSFAEQKRFTYTGEGWGLCYDGADLVMSNGSNKIVFRDPATFAIRREITVQQNGTTFDQLNELECVGSLLYVNVWKTNTILRLEKATGNVLTQIDASGLLTADETKAADVLNGIAYDDLTQHFYLTGKYWPKVFEVAFDFDPDGDGDAGAPDAGMPDTGTSDAGTSDASPDAGAPRDAPSSDRSTMDATASSDARVDSSDVTSSDVTPPLEDAGRVDAPPTDAMTFDGGSPTNETVIDCACRLGAHRASRSSRCAWGLVGLLMATRYRRCRDRRRERAGEDG